LRVAAGTLQQQIRRNLQGTHPFFTEKQKFGERQALIYICPSFVDVFEAARQGHGFIIVSSRMTVDLAVWIQI